MPKPKCDHGKGGCCDLCHVEGCKKKKVFRRSALAGLAQEMKNVDPLEWLHPELREITKRLKDIDPIRYEAEVKAWWAVQHVKEEIRQADEKDKKNRTGKYDPINIKLTNCRICSGDVVQRLRWSRSCNPRIGGPSDSHRVHDCYFCKSCGIQYAFVAKQEP